VSVEHFPFILSSAIKDDSYPPRLLQVIYTMVGYAPHRSVIKRKFTLQDPLSIALVNSALHEECVVLPVSRLLIILT